MPQSNNVRVKEISQHTEHTADRAAVSHPNQTHLTPQESERQIEEHGRQLREKDSQKPKHGSKK